MPGATSTASCAGVPSGAGWSSSSGWPWPTPPSSVAGSSAAPGPTIAGKAVLAAAHERLLAQALSGSDRVPCRPEPATCCLGDNCRSSVLYGPVGSSQVRLGGVSGERGLVRFSCGLWNDRQRRERRTTHDCGRLSNIDFGHGFWTAAEPSWAGEWWLSQKRSRFWTANGRAGAAGPTAAHSSGVAVTSIDARLAATLASQPQQAGTHRTPPLAAETLASKLSYAGELVGWSWSWMWASRPCSWGGSLWGSWVWVRAAWLCSCWWL